MLLVKKVFFSQMLACFLGLLLIQPSQAADLVLKDTTTDRASLTQATLELQRDLILAREKVIMAEKQGLAIYLDIDAPAPKNMDRFSVSLNDEVIVDTEFNQEQLDKLVSGAIQKLLVTELEPGTYELATKLRADGSNVTKKISLNKELNRLNFKITITNLPIKETPEIFFDYENWEPLQ